MKREEAEKIYDLGKDVVVDLILQLVDRIEKLEAQVKKNSNNSSKPPSSDGLKRKKKTKSQRKKSGKSSGGQKGHEGKNLEMTASPDEIIVLTVDKCDCCGESLVNVKVKDFDKRQESDIPEIKVHTTEYQAEVKDCSNCGTENKADFPEGITHKAQYGNHLRAIAVYFRNYELIPVERSAEIFEDIFGVYLSEGTIVNTTKRCAKLLTGFSDWILNKLIDSNIVHFDETGVNVEGKLHWLHSAGTSSLTSYFVHKKRGSDAFDAMGILPEFKGRAVHDHWQSYFKYDCEHALCNAHHLRELIFVYEHHEQQWAKKMLDFLCEIKENVDIRKSDSLSFEHDEIKKFERKYKRILREGFKANPPPDNDFPGKRGRKFKGKVIRLLERLRDFQKETLAFMYDFNVPFDNNLAERDIRMVKVQQKISGLFRTSCGAEQFCLIRSFISTVKKQGFSVIDALEKVLAGEQVYLEFFS